MAWADAKPSALAYGKPNGGHMITHKIDRRTLVGTAGAGALAALLPTPPLFAAQGSGLRAAADKYLALLDRVQTANTRFAFDDPTRRAWEFRGTHQKPGLVIEHMNSAQKEAVYEILETALSKPGYDKLRLIMTTQDVMRELGRGPKDRNAERFWISVFGTPSDHDVWGLRIEGHHISLSWTLKGDEIVAVTPASFSVIPQHIPVGQRSGTVVLEREEMLGRKLIKDLSASKRTAAIIADAPPGDVLALAGREHRFDTKKGIAIADMASAQRDMLWKLIETTTVEPWPGSASAIQVKRIREGDPEAIHFAWAGGIEPGEMYYYRIHGDTFTLELTSVLGDPEHLHAVFHDPQRTLGMHITG